MKLRMLLPRPTHQTAQAASVLGDQRLKASHDPKLFRAESVAFLHALNTLLPRRRPDRPKLDRDV